MGFNIRGRKNRHRFALFKHNFKKTPQRVSYRESQYKKARKMGYSRRKSLWIARHRDSHEMV